MVVFLVLVVQRLEIWFALSGGGHDLAQRDQTRLESTDREPGLLEALQAIRVRQAVGRRSIRPLSPAEGSLIELGDLPTQGDRIGRGPDRYTWGGGFRLQLRLRLRIVSNGSRGFHRTPSSSAAPDVSTDVLQARRLDWPARA